MIEREINESIRNAIEETTPDILSQLEQELGFDQKQAQDIPVIVTKPARKRSRVYKRLAGLAAVLVLCIGGFAMYDRQPQVCAIVDLDVNPSIEFSVDDNDRVISATAVNPDGEDVLSGLDFSGSDISVAGNAVVGVMLSKGYLTDTSNSILVSVRGNDEAKSKAIEEKLSAELNGYLENAQISAAVLGQYVKEDDALADFAGTHEISEGKAWLIRELLAKDQRLTEDSLLKLSTQEMVLLGQEKGVFQGASYGTADKSQYISPKKALRIAAKKAGLTLAKGENPADKLDHYTVEFDCDDGQIIYEVDFRTGGMEYEYDIDAVSGEILDSDAERSDEDGYDRDDDDEWDDRDDGDDRYDREDNDWDDRDDDNDDRYDRDDDDDDDDRDDRDDDDDDDDDD